MLIDKQAQFSDAQAITASAASTNYLDLGVVRNIAVGQDLYLVMVVTTAFTDDSSNSTVTPSLQTDSVTTFDSALVTVATFDVMAALTAANTKRMYKLSPYNDAGLFKRYVRLYYTVANGALSTGAITAFLTADAQSWKAYAVGFTVT